MASMPNPTYIYFDISTKLAHDIPSIPGKRIMSDFVLLDNYAGFHFVSQPGQAGTKKVAESVCSWGRAERAPSR